MWTVIRRCFCRHDYAIRSAPGKIFLCCRNCGDRTPGWQLHTRPDSIEDGRNSTRSDGLAIRVNPRNVPVTF